MSESRIVLVRRERITELLDWAKNEPKAGIESRMYYRAMEKYLVSDMTARSYAKTVLAILKGAQTSVG